MCSNADVENDGTLLMESGGANSLGDIYYCRKCTDKTKASVVLRKKDAYCKQCFLSSVTHKFRACLGKAKVMQPGDEVLIAFSGTSNSVALLHLIQTGLQDTSHKKLMFKPNIVYIDETPVLNMKNEEQRSILNKISEVLEPYTYPQYSVPLDMCLRSEEELEDHLKTCESFRDSKELRPGVRDDGTLKQLFDSLPEVSARVDLLVKLRHNLLVQIAKSLQCLKVFTAESADDLAVSLLTNVSLGRGAQLPFDVGFCDNRNGDVKVIRPLRDISKKELAFYHVFQGLASVHVPSLTTKSAADSSIQKLTEKFLCELQNDFPSTLSTVFRVADKLTSSADKGGVCSLCKAPLDTESVTLASLSATHFSARLSSLGLTNFDAEALTEKSLRSGTGCCSVSGDLEDTSCCGSGSCSSRCSKEDLQRMLCYGCNLILRNTNLQTIPDSLMRHLRESNQRFKMKKEIEDFLL